MELVILSMDKNLLFVKGNECNTHVEQIVFVIFIDEEVKNFINQWDFNVSILSLRYFANTVSIYWVTTMERGI
jgi:hypothetical protein